jgi:HEXXH motif-containing protein
MTIAFTDLIRPRAHQPPTQASARAPGLVFPDPLAQDLEVRLFRSRLQRRTRAVSEITADFAASRLPPAGAHELLQAIASASPVRAHGLFDDALSGTLFGPPREQLVDDIPFSPSANDRWSWLAACALESEIAVDVIVPPGPTGSPPLYLPRAHALVDLGGGAAAVLRSEQRRKLVRDDGGALTINPAVSMPEGLHGGGWVRGLPRACGHAILNGVPIFASLAPAQLDEARTLSAAIEHVTAGLDLLAEVWPATRSFADAWLRGFLLLRWPGFARSHTSQHAPQVVMCSAESAVKVAEAICHEGAHTRMHLFLEDEALLDDAGEAVHPSPWRKDARPLVGLIHGVHAFLNVRELYRRLGERRPVQRREWDAVVARETRRIREAWTYLLRQARWTAAGEAVATDLDGAVKELGP